MSDQELVRRVLKQQPGAFEELFGRYADRVFRRIASIIGSETDGEDLVQAVFVRVYRSLPRYRGKASLSTWIYRISVNVALNHLRDSRRYREQVPMDDAVWVKGVGSAPSFVETLEDREQIRILYALLAKLPESQRVVFTLHEIEGLTLDEISKQLDCPLHTAASRLRSARERLRRAMAKTLKIRCKPLRRAS
jgi:RNA polymerase sigma-70 factor (ECF subfamily)